MSILLSSSSDYLRSSIFARSAVVLKVVYCTARESKGRARVNMNRLLAITGDIIMIELYRAGGDAHPLEFVQEMN